MPRRIKRANPSLKNLQSPPKKANLRRIRNRRRPRELTLLKRTLRSLMKIPVMKGDLEVLQLKAKNPAQVVARAVEAILKQAARRIAKPQLLLPAARVELRRMTSLSRRKRIVRVPALPPPRKRRRRQKRRMPKYRSRNLKVHPAAPLALAVLDQPVKRIKKRRRHLQKRAKVLQKRVVPKRRRDLRESQVLLLVAAPQAVMVSVPVQALALQAVTRK